jgi:hypothetical protein
VVQPNVGDGRGDDQRELPGPRHILRAVRGIKRDGRVQTLVVGHRSWRECNYRHHSAQRLFDAPGHDVPGAAIDDVGLPAMLIVTRLGVRVAIDNLDCPLGVLELHLLLVLALAGNVLLAYPLAGRHAIMAGLLLLLLTELLHELLDLPALLSAVVPGVMHWTLWPALITIGRLARSLVATWEHLPVTYCCWTSSSFYSCSYHCSEQRHLPQAYRPSLPSEQAGSGMHALLQP